MNKKWNEMTKSEKTHSIIGLLLVGVNFAEKFL